MTLTIKKGYQVIFYHKDLVIGGVGATGDSDIEIHYDEFKPLETYYFDLKTDKGFIQFVVSKWKIIPLLYR